MCLCTPFTAIPILLPSHTFHSYSHITPLAHLSQLFPYYSLRTPFTAIPILLPLHTFHSYSHITPFAHLSQLFPYYSLRTPFTAIPILLPLHTFHSYSHITPFAHLSQLFPYYSLSGNQLKYRAIVHNALHTDCQFIQLTSRETADGSLKLVTSFQNFFGQPCLWTRLFQVPFPAKTIQFISSTKLSKQVMGASASLLGGKVVME